MKIKLFTFFISLISLISFGQITLVKDLNPGQNRSTFDYSFTFKNKFYSEAVFEGDRKMIETDGTEEGTKNFTYEGKALFGDGTVSYEIDEYSDFYTIANDSLYLSAGRSLVISDGNTAKGVTVDQSDFNSFKSISNLTEYKGDIYFSADYRVFSPSFINYTKSLFKYDGISISLVKNVISGTSFFTKTKIKNSMYLFFAGSDSENGNELWRTDGTEAGTVLIKDIATGTSSGVNLNLDESIVFNDIVYFVARDNSDNGWELWRSDGSETGTYMVKNISTSGSFKDSEPTNFTIYNNKLYFFAKNRGTNSGTHKLYDLWETDGTENGTVKIKNIGAEIANGDYFDGDVIQFNNLMYFKGGGKLWKSDGTESGTIAITDATTRYRIPDKLVVYNSEIYYVHNNNLWKTDGTTANITKITNDEFSILKDIHSTPEKVYFIGDKDNLGEELYSYKDATASVIKNNQNNISIFYADNSIYIKGLTSQKNSVTVYNTLGKVVKNMNLNTTKQNSLFLAVTTGLYFVKLKTENGEIIQKKIFIH